MDPFGLEPIVSKGMLNEKFEVVERKPQLEMGKGYSDPIRPYPFVRVRVYFF